MCVNVTRFLTDCRILSDPDTPILQDKEQLRTHGRMYARTHARNGVRFPCGSPRTILSVPLSLSSSLVSSNLAGCSTSIFLNGPPLTALLSPGPSALFDLIALPFDFLLLHLLLNIALYRRLDFFRSTFRADAHNRARTAPHPEWGTLR